jgi:prophage regulatory protein
MNLRLEMPLKAPSGDKEFKGMRGQKMVDEISRHEHEPLERMLRRPEVERITGLKRSTIYVRMRDKTFPQAVPLGSKAVGWRESEISAWLKDCIRARG